MGIRSLPCGMMSSADLLKESIQTFFLERLFLILGKSNLFFHTHVFEF